MAEHNELGKSGEKEAVKFLRAKGYTILETNYVYDRAEVDIIAKTGKTLVAVEVKTRSTPEFGDPQDFVKPAQIKRLVKAVNYYINEKNLDLEVRFDIVAIIKNKLGKHIEHLEDAFYYFE
jgi:putative endonuclease